MTNIATVRLVKTIELAMSHIVASPYVKGYAIGLTGNPSSRFVAYRQEAAKDNDYISGFVLLSWEMPRATALMVEEEIYSFIQRDKRSHAYKKAHPRFHGRYYPSASRNFDKHFLYLCW